MVQTAKSNWKAQPESINLADATVSLIVDAYQKGKADGYKDALTNEAKILAKTFNQNLLNAMAVSENLNSQITNLYKIELPELYLKIESKTQFTTALIVPYEFYISESYKQLTELLIDVELENETDTFKIDFTTIPKKESLNRDKLLADGFIFSYLNGNG
mgnify:CR=1 FL=1